MRIFVALVLPEPFKAELIAITALLRTSQYPLRWTPAKNLHLTLAFLGELDETGTTLAIESTRRATRRHIPFSLSFLKLVAYPRRGATRILAAAFSKGDREAASRASELENELDTIGRGAGFRFREREAKPYAAHVTLARSARVPVKLGPEALGTDSSVESSTRIETLAVFESRLQRNGAEYVKLAEFPLAEDP